MAFSDKELLEYIKQPLVKHKSKNEDVKIIGYKIYYGDGRVLRAKGDYRSLYERWKELPYEDIQLIMLYENQEGGRFYFSGFDYYLFNGREFMACNDSRKFPYIPEKSLKYGWFLNEGKFSKIVQLAAKDFGI